MEKEVLKALKEKCPTLEVSSNSVCSLEETLKRAEKGGFWEIFALCEQLMQISLEEDTRENNVELCIKCLNTCVEYGRKVYLNRPDAGCFILTHAYRSYPAMFKLVNGEWEEDFKTEKEQTLLAAKFALEGYKKHGDLYMGVEYVDIVRTPVYEELNPQEGIKILKEILINPDCPAEAYEIMAEELMMGKRIEQDIEKSLAYFDKAIEMGDETAAYKKEHFYSHFGNKKKKHLFW